jgi:hypothetical protein
MIRLVHWLRQVWPNAQRRRHLIGEYAAIGAQHKLFLADVALRGGLYSDIHARGDDTQTFVNIGRRELALEIIQACGESAMRLIELVERPEKKDPAR